MAFFLLFIVFGLMILGTMGVKSFSDKMVEDAQMALRRIIELNSDRARFIFICEDMEKIIEAADKDMYINKYKKKKNPDLHIG